MISCAACHMLPGAEALSAIRALPDRRPERGGGRGGAAVTVGADEGQAMTSTQHDFL